jgi:tetratricopeptide (TPR) repeat protein
MLALRRSRLVVAFLSLILLLGSMPLPVGAQATNASPQDAQLVSELETSLEQARERIKEGDYDRAIEVLKKTIANAQPDALRNAYLLLIKTYVFLGNDLRFKPQGREASNLNYQEARKRIEEALRIPELRHTVPEPASEYPPEMIDLFAQVRSQIFGSFRVVKLEPAGAVVLLNADTLRALPGDSLLGDVNLLVGPYRVAVHAKGYKDVNEEILISPNSTLERPYRLSRKRGPAWYATASTAALALVAGIVAATRSSGPPSQEPLPPAPPPPTRSP